jgi:hypothetical protein
MELVFDTVVDPPAPGTRGNSPARHLLFHSEGWDLDLMICRSKDAITLTGQILPQASENLSSVFNAVVILMQGDDELVQSSKLSSRGEFEFHPVPDADLKLEIFLEAQRLTASFHT